ncbi:MAG: tyrosine-type recombinase/integrase, partial [Alphaproteobacteria bacterium]
MQIVDYRGKWCLQTRIDGERKRLSTGYDATPENREAAERQARRLQAEIAKPSLGSGVEEIVRAYLDDTRAIHKQRMEDAWKALRWAFAPLNPDQITRATCRDYVASRRAEGRADGTIRKELTVLRAALRWADPKTPAIFELPRPGQPRERWLTRDEFARLLEAASDTFHLNVFLHLAIATAARKEALLTLTWHQVRFDDGMIWLGRKEGGKNRGTVPMTGSLRAVLREAKEVALTERVIEYAGHPVGSIRTALRRAAKSAKVSGVTPHVLRHTAATWMTMDGVPIEEVARVLGHSDPKVTWRVYAK